MLRLVEPFWLPPLQLHSASSFLNKFIASPNLPPDSTLVSSSRDRKSKITIVSCENLQKQQTSEHELQVSSFNGVNEKTIHERWIHSCLLTCHPWLCPLLQFTPSISFCSREARLGNKRPQANIGKVLHDREGISTHTSCDKVWILADGSFISNHIFYLLLKQNINLW